ncbi:unnamed protein product [Mycena citricolor]|uniref:Uncharacterized protein n=1 Tax=Mycena citricolor TaxID=2018698 RepID=A0AAD2HAH6_9AGAR|nr:unnamed protein product [Mycena citricolor]
MGVIRSSLLEKLLDRSIGIQKQILNYIRDPEPSTRLLYTMPRSERRTARLPPPPLVVGYAICVQYFYDVITPLPDYRKRFEGPGRLGPSLGPDYWHHYAEKFEHTSHIFIPVRTVLYKDRHRQCNESPFDQAHLADMVRRIDSLGGVLDPSRVKWRQFKPRSRANPKGYDNSMYASCGLFPPVRRVQYPPSTIEDSEVV